MSDGMSVGNTNIHHQTIDFGGVRDKLNEDLGFRPWISANMTSASMSNPLLKNGNVTMSSMQKHFLSTRYIILKHMHHSHRPTILMVL